MLLKRAQAADPATANAEAQVRIQSLETQLNNAVQQLNRLHAERASNAADVGSSSQPASGGWGSGLIAQVSPHPGRVLGEPTAQAPPSRGRGMRGLDARRLLTPPSVGRGLLGRFA